ncbi:MAG: hypothetical protein E6K46_11875 [Gammaproteobacteria bacterium]|nr:MAG: hypothetical protein E6K46_11875 [Gammaproteobacteria bacterium]
MKKSTRVNHPPPVELPPDNRPLVAPIYQTVKFEFDTLEETERYLRGERPGFYYTRGSNPTTRQLEQLLAVSSAACWVASAWRIPCYPSRTS